MTDAAVLRLVVSLIFVVLLILAIAWISRKSGWIRPKANQALKILSVQSVGTRAHVAILEVEDARLVVGITGNQINLLHTLPPAAPSLAEPAPPVATGFHAILSRTLKRH
ncbi:flagellar biosynthetic protein FliO [Alcaligenaceae bacterium]|nr:flagellar biosynthetic protein FliO [Alcaligenaceae bacterium]